MTTQTPIVITGAAGFVGQATVAAARKAGHPVRAILRNDRSVPDAWAADDAISVHIADLAQTPDLGAVLNGAGAVIHAAASADNSQDTQTATAHLVDALVGRGVRLVLVSSLSVYGYAAMPRNATLDETTPTDPDITRRDTYAQTKLAQEMQAIAAAQTRDLDLWILRPGAIYGPDRLWSARLGYPKGSRVIVPGGTVPVPAIHVDSCAAGLVAAAIKPRADRSDLPIIAGDGAVNIINLIDPNPPSQHDWLAALGKTSLITLPLSPLLKIAGGLDLIADLWPAVGRRLPTGLREATLAARFKPLRYARARAEDRLDHHPTQSCVDALKSLKQKQQS